MLPRVKRVIDATNGAATLRIVDISDGADHDILSVPTLLFPDGNQATASGIIAALKTFLAGL